MTIPRYGQLTNVLTMAHIDDHSTTGKWWKEHSYPMYSWILIPSWPIIKHENIRMFQLTRIIVHT
jgi:hypothetical protein